jgi:anti-anti-sigma factor
LTAPSVTVHVVLAPEELSLDSRTAFRSRAVTEIDAMSVGAGRLVIDMTGTRTIDSAGLGALILVRRRAAGRRVRVALRGVNDEIRALLTLTKLADLFEVEPARD